MPFVPADIAKCPKCQKSVYAAEERVAGGLKWHKQCFKCGLCNKFLDSTNANCHENELFCKVCHARKYGPKGYGFGGGAGALSMDTGAHLGNTDCVSNRPDPISEKPMSQAPEGEGCPRCGGHVYAAEQMLARGRSWHKKCYKCKDCRKQLDSTNTCEGPDNDIYCKVCYSKNFGPKGYGYGLGAGCLQSDALNASSNAEQMRPSKPDLGVIKAADGQGCPRCGGAVFAAEQMLARGTVWHKTCFNCNECHRVLDSVLACDGPDRDVYCKLCYAKKFGPKGYGFGGGSAFLMSDSIPNGIESAMKSIDTKSIKAPEGQGCPRCGGSVFAAEQMLSKGREWHKLCFNCADCHRPLDSVLACDGPDKDIYCKACYGKHFGPKGFGYGHSPTLVSTGTGEAYVPSEAKPGLKAPEGEGCPRCGFQVYAAEQMIGKNRVWHKRCFNCCDCHRSLDSTNLNDSIDNEIYCAGCYRKKYGPHGVGYGMGAGALQTF